MSRIVARVAGLVGSGLCLVLIVVVIWGAWRAHRIGQAVVTWQAVSADRCLIQVDRVRTRLNQIAASTRNWQNELAQLAKTELIDWRSDSLENRLANMQSMTSQASEWLERTTESVERIEALRQILGFSAAAGPFDSAPWFTSLITIQDDLQRVDQELTAWLDRDRDPPAKRVQELAQWVGRIAVSLGAGQQLLGQMESGLAIWKESLPAQQSRWDGWILLIGGAACGILLWMTCGQWALWQWGRRSPAFDHEGSMRSQTDQAHSSAGEDRAGD